MTVETKPCGGRGVRVFGWTLGRPGVPCPAIRKLGTTGMTITVYSKPACVQCTATTRALDARGLDYRLIDLTEDDAAMDLVTSLGYRQAPVVIAGDAHWAGFRPDKIGALA